MSLEVKNFSVSYSINGAHVRVVKNISFVMKGKERVGLVGESGCGKTALVTALLGLDPAQRTEGSALFEGNPPSKMRGREIGIVFQDPITFLNPTMKIGAQIKEGPLFHRLASSSLAEKRAIELLQLVGIAEPELRAGQYPHQLSGGQRQRVLIAIALASKPKLMIADEPTTSLDPSIASQILDLLKNLSEQLDMALLLITHDLRAVASTCDRVLVMHEGKLVEDNSVEEIFYNPQHVYTKSLLHSLRLPI